MSITRPNPYVPSFLRAAASGSRPVRLTWSDVSDTNIASTASFSYDPHSTGLKSTQQLNVDWSQFQNHTFFMSAEAKVNLAFDQIINGFPFDGTRLEVETFFDGLSGFDRWVFDRFPTWRGELLFSGTQPGEASPGAGTYVVVQNKAGALFPELAGDASGMPVLNPTGSQSMTVEMQLYLPPQSNDVQVVCQMMSGSAQGFSFHLLSASSTTSVTAEFSVVSGSSYMSVPVQLAKGQFNHVALVLDRDDGLPSLASYLGSTFVAGSKLQSEMGDLAIDSSSLIIGSGTQVSLGTTTVSPVHTLSGTLDEFRVFHSARTPQQQAAYSQKALFATSDLVLYLRFNEPPPPIALTTSDPINSVVLDSSGNSLHSFVSNFTGSLRLNAAADALNPCIYERVESLPVLFPAYPGVVALNSELLASASAYDAENPNLITRLVPQHYLLDGAQQDGFEELEGTAGQPFGGSGIPGQGTMGNSQILVSLLYIWARFFDEIKLFVDSFSTLRTVDYDTDDTIPDTFLVDLIKEYGFHLPPLFNDSTVEQYVQGENVAIESISTNEFPLRSVQNQLLRRVLKNLPDVLRSKGTLHSIQSFLRAVGIDPSNSIRLREFGGPTSRQLTYARETKFEPGSMVQFSTSSLVVSPFLTASRTEPGFPLPVGSFVEQSAFPPNGVSNNVNDGLLTSGSWTWEGIVKYTPAALATMQSVTQSLVRLCTTGSSNGGGPTVVANLIAVSASVPSATAGDGEFYFAGEPKLVLYVRPGDSPSAPLLRMEMDTPGAGIFNSDKWNVSFGCQRGDDGLGTVSSSYFLRMGYQNNGRIESQQVTASFFQEAPTGHDAFRNRLTGSNASGSFIAVGTGQIVQAGTGSTFLHLNDASAVPSEARTTVFDGRMSNVRFWSRALSVAEWQEHVRNYSSTGVEDPLTGWNYVRSQSGSFGRLRLSSMSKQAVRTANATASLGPLGAITFIDYSENGLHLTGSGFPIQQECVVGDVFDLSYFSPYFDEASTTEKVRSRSYLDPALVQQAPWSGTAPVYEINRSESPTDDVRFIIEFSLVDALNRDIVLMFGTLDSLDNALGSPDLLASVDYPDLENLRTVYFNRLKQRLNFQAFFDFFRWFDTSIGTFIEQLIPRKTRFKGTNFTIESHMLERHKVSYEAQSQIYLGDSNRTNLDSVIFLQQITGMFTKY